MRAYHEKVMAILAVDDFAPEELSRSIGNGYPKKTANVTKKVSKKRSKKIVRKTKT